jgi:hypothetical protein
MWKTQAEFLRVIFPQVTNRENPELSTVFKALNLMIIKWFLTFINKLTGTYISSEIQ